MFSFEILNQDGEIVAATRYGDFTLSILQLGAAPLDVYVVRLATAEDLHSAPVAVYGTLRRATDACNHLQKFARNVRRENQMFVFNTDDDASPLAIVALLDGRPTHCIDTGRTPADEAHAVRRTLHSC